MPRYKPIVLDVAMNPMGYWVALISVLPGCRQSITITVQGIEPEAASDLALQTLSVLSDPYRGSDQA